MAAAAPDEADVDVHRPRHAIEIYFFWYFVFVVLFYLITNNCYLFFFFSLIRMVM